MGGFSDLPPEVQEFVLTHAAHKVETAGRKDVKEKVVSGLTAYEAVEDKTIQACIPRHAGYNLASFPVTRKNRALGMDGVQAVFQTCEGADQSIFTKDWAARDPDAEEVAIISARAALKKFQADRVLIVERDTVSTVDSAMQMQIDTASSPLSTSLSQSRGAAGTRRQAGQGEGPT
ncbi:hypothetical protein JCM8202v2_001778 [Rhodotorula sphaerocarpa]